MKLIEGRGLDRPETKERSQDAATLQPRDAALLLLLPGNVGDDVTQDVSRRQRPIG